VWNGLASPLFSFEQIPPYEGGSGRPVHLRSRYVADLSVTDE
jgi:hypothetical protein